MRRDPESQIGRAETLLRLALEAGPQPVARLEAAAASVAISPKALGKARLRLGCLTRKIRGGWAWSLPADTHAPEARCEGTPAPEPTPVEPMPQDAQIAAVDSPADDPWYFEVPPEVDCFAPVDPQPVDARPLPVPVTVSPEVRPDVVPRVISTEPSGNPWAYLEEEPAAPSTGVSPVAPAVNPSRPVIPQASHSVIPLDQSAAVSPLDHSTSPSTHPVTPRAASLAHYLKVPARIEPLGEVSQQNGGRCASCGSSSTLHWGRVCLCAIDARRILAGQPPMTPEEAHKRMNPGGASPTSPPQEVSQ